MEEFGKEGIPFLTAKSLNNGRIDIEGAPRLSEQRASELPFGFVQTGDVLLSHNATIGRVAVVPEYRGKLLIGTSLTYFRVDTTKLSPRYLAAYFSATDFQQQLSSVMSHSTRNQVPITAQRSLTIILPSLAEQILIGDFLGAMDDRLNLWRETNESIESIARTVFKSWFVDFDPVRAKAEGREPEGMDAATAALFPDCFQTSSTRTVPKGWRIAPFSEVAGVIYGAPFASKSFNAERIGIPLVRIRDLKTMEPTVFTDEVHPKGYLLSPGDVVVGMDGEFRAYHWLGDPSWLNQRVCAFLPKVPAGKVFVREALRPLLEAVERGQVGTTVIHIGKADIDKFMTIVPSASVLSAFNDIAESALTRIALNAATARSLTELRDTLLPRLISGKLRVPEAEKLVEAVL